MEKSILEEKPMFEPDFGKELFEIKIMVCENCSKISLTPQGEHKVGYYELVGALQSALNRYMFEQSFYNRMQGLKEKEKVLNNVLNDAVSDTTGSPSSNTADNKK